MFEDAGGICFENARHAGRAARTGTGLAFPMVGIGLFIMFNVK
jgi:hypothetical protein